MNLKYTEEQEKELTTEYTNCKTHDEHEDYILKFMGKYGHSKRSVIAKLSKMSIYVARPKVSKVTGGEPETKKQILQKIANKLGMDISKLEGVDKSPKLSLLNVLRRLEE